MKIIAVAHNFIQLMRMMPAVESIASITKGSTHYCATCDYHGTDYKKWVTEDVKNEFLGRDIVTIGPPYRIGRKMYLFLADNAPDLVFWWSGVSIGTSVINQMKKRCKIIFCEVGFFPQLEHLYLDCQGINYLSSARSTPCLAIDETQQAKLSDKIERFKNSTFKEDKNFKEHGYIFLPLQLEHDTQIRKFSPNFKRNKDLINFLSKEFREEEIIAKPHPLDTKAASYVSKWANVRIATSVNTHQLIKNAKFVIGINSTVLIEALLYNKKVVAFGKGLFTGKNVVVEAHDNLKKAKMVYSFIPDCATIQNFLYQVAFHCQLKVADLNENNIVTKYYVDVNDAIEWYKRNLDESCCRT